MSYKLYPSKGKVKYLSVKVHWPGSVPWRNQLRSHETVFLNHTLVVNQTLRVLLRLLNQRNVQIQKKKPIVLKSFNHHSRIDLCDLHSLRMFTSASSSFVSHICCAGTFALFVFPPL